MTEPSIRPTRADHRLANAVLHLANALDNPCGIAGVGPSCEAARDLVRDIAFPDHAEKVRPTSAPRGPIGFTRQTQTRPDGTLETRDRLWSPAPSPAHVPVPDPSDGVAFGADPAMWAAGLAYLATVELQALHRCDTPQPEGVTNEEGHFAQEAYKRATGAPVLGVGITNALGAAAAVRRAGVYQQALDGQRHEADRVMVRAVEPSHPGPDDDRDTWVLDPGATGHRAPFAVGDFVVRSSGREGIHRIVKVSVIGDAPRHRSLILKVAPTDVVVDADAF